MCSAITLHVESSVYENGEVLMNSFVLPFFPELARGQVRENKEVARHLADRIVAFSGVKVQSRLINFLLCYT